MPMQMRLQLPRGRLLGGRVVPAWPSQRPVWLGDAPIALLDGLLVWFDRGTDTHIHRAGAVTHGASFALSRDAMRTNGEFHPDLGGRVASWVAVKNPSIWSAYAAAEAWVSTSAKPLRITTDMKRLRLWLPIATGFRRGSLSDALEASKRAAHFEPGFTSFGGSRSGCGDGDRFRQCMHQWHRARLMRDGWRK